MRTIVALAVGAVLLTGLGGGYILYRQLGSDTVTLEGEPVLQADGQGAECGEVSFSVGARALGRWMYGVGKGKTVTGTVTVGGNADQDIGLTIDSPTNRTVFFDPARAHEIEFEIVGTIRGEYRFEFDNRHSSFSDKQVTVSLCVT
jgi:hypothetical protein